MLKNVRMGACQIDRDGRGVNASGKVCHFIVFFWSCFFCCLQTWSIVPNGDPCLLLRLSRLSRNSLSTTWTEPSGKPTYLYKAFALVFGCRSDLSLRVLSFLCIFFSQSYIFLKKKIVLNKMFARVSGHCAVWNCAKQTDSWLAVPSLPSDRCFEKDLGTKWTPCQSEINTLENHKMSVWNLLFHPHCLCCKVV